MPRSRGTLRRTRSGTAPRGTARSCARGGTPRSSRIGQKGLTPPRGATARAEPRTSRPGRDVLGSARAVAPRGGVSPFWPIREMTVASLLWRSFWPFLAAQFLSIYSLGIDGPRSSRSRIAASEYSVAAQSVPRSLGSSVPPCSVPAASTRCSGHSRCWRSWACRLHGRFRPAAASESRVTARRRRLHAAVTLALAGCFLFFFNVNCYWTYVEPIGVPGYRRRSSLRTSRVAVRDSGGAASWWGRRSFSRCALHADDRGGRGDPGRDRGRTSAPPLSIISPGICPSPISTLRCTPPTRRGRGIAITPRFHGAGAAVEPAVAANIALFTG